MTRRRTKSAVREFRCGTTMAEVFVTLSVLSLLAAIALPAVQSARESSRRMQCVDHLRQLALATQTHISMRNTELPFTSTNGSDQQGRQVLPSVSPHSHLLPFLDQSALHSRIDFSDMTVNAPGGLLTSAIRLRPTC